jgi:hypothetical protein
MYLLVHEACQLSSAYSVPPFQAQVKRAGQFIQRAIKHEIIEYSVYLRHMPKLCDGSC